jgi:hypothetical protein
MSAHYRPVDVVGCMLEEGSAVASLKPLEDLTNAVCCKGHLNLSFSVTPIKRHDQ